MKPALFSLILGLMLLFSGCIQPEEAPLVTEKAAIEEWKANGIIGESEYSHSMVLKSPVRQGV